MGGLGKMVSMKPLKRGHGKVDDFRASSLLDRACRGTLVDEMCMRVITPVFSLVLKKPALQCIETAYPICTYCSSWDVLRYLMVPWCLSRSYALSVDSNRYTGLQAPGLRLCLV